MKNVSTLIRCLLICSITIVLSAFQIESVQAQTKEDGMIDSMSEDEKAIYQQSLSQYDANVVYNALIARFNQSTCCDKAYPSDYAGAYIDDDSKLVILLSKEREGVGSTRTILDSIDWEKICLEDEILKAHNLNDIIRFVKVDYSLNHLDRVKDQLFAELNYSGKVQSAFVDQERNTVCFTCNYNVKVEFEEKVSSFLNKFEENAVPVEILVEEKEPQTEAHHLGGQGSYNGGTTLGFTGYYNETKAFISCGHKYYAGNAVYNGNTVGTVVARRYNNNMAGDWSISTLNSSQTISGLIKQNGSGSMTGKIKGKVNLVANNTIVYTFGNGTQVWSSYKVTNNDCDVVYDSGATTILELCSATLKTGTGSTGGDSGAPWVVPYGSNWKAVGIHSGSNNVTRYFSPMKHIPTTFSLCIAS